MISQNDYTIFCEEYYTTKPQHQRFGQAFWNRFLTHESQKEERLFYCADKLVCENIIWEHYIIKE